MKKIIFLVALLLSLAGLPIVSKALIICIPNELNNNCPNGTAYIQYPIYGGPYCDVVTGYGTTTVGGLVPNKDKCVPNPNICPQGQVCGPGWNQPTATEQSTTQAELPTTITSDISSDNSEQIQALQTQLIALLQKLIQLLNQKASLLTGNK